MDSNYTTINNNNQKFNKWYLLFICNIYFCLFTFLVYFKVYYSFSIPIEFYYCIIIFQYVLYTEYKKYKLNFLHSD